MEEALHLDHLAWSSVAEGLLQRTIPTFEDGRGSLSHRGWCVSVNSRCWISYWKSNSLVCERIVLALYGLCKFPVFCSTHRVKCTLRLLQFANWVAICKLYRILSPITYWECISVFLARAYTYWLLTIRKIQTAHSKQTFWKAWTMSSGIWQIACSESPSCCWQRLPSNLYSLRYTFIELENP